eukprot:6204487-Pleurochrysis_carterae.AAC.2
MSDCSAADRGGHSATTMQCSNAFALERQRASAVRVDRHQRRNKSVQPTLACLVKTANVGQISLNRATRLPYSGQFHQIVYTIVPPLATAPSDLSAQMAFFH